MDRIIQCINQLTQSGKLEVLQTANRELLWRLRDASADRRLDGLDTKEVMVYEQLRAFGNKGASAQQLQSRSAMPQREIGKCLNSLEAKKLVKIVRPAGTFFSGEGFDQEFVDVLCQQCTLYLRRKAEAAATSAATTSASATLEEVQQFIGQSRVSTVALSLDDIRRVLRALTLEGVVETRPGPYAGAGSSCLYRLARSQLPASGDFGAVRVPCVSCPVAPDCRIGGEISPIGCVYLTDWAKGQF
uniref:DNA-directed RNA polymerase III subunit RPC6 n=1 Tax=Macrostomum lignano TaxID=282301 RepID=A0A1I8H640_9PLAT